MDKPRLLLTFGGVDAPISWKHNACRLRLFAALCVALVAPYAATGTDSTQKAPAPWSYQLYAEGYYVYDNGFPAKENRQDFFFNHNRHAQLAINLAAAKISYKYNRWKGNVAVLGGTYSADNYAAEPAALRHLLEANVGYRLHRTEDWWLEAGVFPSHIGFESAFSFDNFTLSRSILAENSPYFLSGAQIKYAKNDWQAALLLLNGWQRIQRQSDQRLPALGTQINRTFGHWVFNWSSFTGRMAPDSLNRWRSFHNTFAIWKPTNRFSAIFGFDIGWQNQSSQRAMWFSPVAIGRYALGKHWFLAARTEYYADPEGGIVPVAATSGFRTWGFSGNVDYMREHWLFRLETRYLQSPSAALNPHARQQSQNLSFIVSISGRLQGSW